MANDKITEEAINNLVAMFSNIDVEMITDIFLGCKKDFDATVDQLVGMGAELDTKKQQSVEKVTSTPPTTANPPESTLTPTPLSDDDNLASDIKRLEDLKQQMSREYRRLADMQENNMNFERQLSTRKSSIAAEQQKLEEERKRFDEQQIVFQQDKKKLEEHLSSRLREMKEQMRKNEEEVRQKEDETRKLEELAREEQLRIEEVARIEAKKTRKQEKQNLKLEKKAADQARREEEDRLADAQLSEYRTTIRNLQEEFDERERILVSSNEVLSARVSDLEKYVVELKEQFGASAYEDERLAKECIVDSLRALSDALEKGIVHFSNKNVLTGDFQAELLNSLREQL